MRELYTAVKAELNRVDFNAIWPGWTKPVPFALVGKDQVYLDGREAPLGDGFWANTVITYEGEMLATWIVENPAEEDIQILASNLVHEMFHGFQGAWEGRGANEMTLMRYPDDLTTYRIKAAEIKLLLRAYTKSDHDALADFISLRKSRAQLLGDVAAHEFWCETGEGTAEFAGLCALMQLSPEKFEKHINQNHLQTLSNPGEKLFSVRYMSYFTGAVLCLTLKKLGVDFYHLLGKDSSLFEVISMTDTIADSFSKYYATKKAKFDDFLAANKNVIVKDAKLTGFDPMNMWRMGDQILCARFVSLDGEGITGPVMLNMVPGSDWQVESIIVKN
ncbi:MAG: hypothetical protein FWC92_02470 [Defluviitaleaceae bacterium]|nr:hypothetical protein [Defluviitaleaceae bacterium]